METKTMLRQVRISFVRHGGWEGDGRVRASTEIDGKLVSTYGSTRESALKALRERVERAELKGHPYTMDVDW